MMLFSSPSQPLLSVHRRPRPKMSTESVIESTCLINIVSNLRRFIPTRDMVDLTSQILFSSSSQPLLSVHRRPRPKMSAVSNRVHVPN